MAYSKHEKEQKLKSYIIRFGEKVRVQKMTNQYLIRMK